MAKQFENMRVARVENGAVVFNTKNKGDWRPMPCAPGLQPPNGGDTITAMVEMDNGPWHIVSWQHGAATEQNYAPSGQQQLESNLQNAVAGAKERQLLITATAIAKVTIPMAESAGRSWQDAMDQSVMMAEYLISKTSEPKGIL